MLDSTLSAGFRFYAPPRRRSSAVSYPSRAGIRAATVRERAGKRSDAGPSVARLLTRAARIRPGLHAIRFAGFVRSTILLDMKNFRWVLLFLLVFAGLPVHASDLTLFGG